MTAPNKRQPTEDQVIGLFVMLVSLCLIVATVIASVDTHAKRCDVEQAQPARVGSATAKPGRPMTAAQLARDSAE